MEITFQPVRHDGELVLERAGDCLTVNGEPFDFAPLPEGDTLPADAVACPWFAGPVRREGGRLFLSLILPHGPGAPAARRFPAPVSVAGDGPVPLPSGGEA